MAETVNPTEVLSSITVKQIDAIAADLEIKVKGKKAEKVKAIAESDKMPQAVEAAELMLAENEQSEDEAREAEVEAEEAKRTPWQDAFLSTLTREQVAAVKDAAIEVEGKSARRNRDALSAMNISRLENDQADEAIHRVPQRIRKMLAKVMDEDSPLNDVPVSDTTGSWVFNTDDPQWLRKQGQAVLALRDPLDERDETQAREPVQQAVLYGSRLIVHADVLEARRERLAAEKGQPELAGTPDADEEEAESK